MKLVNTLVLTGLLALLSNVAFAGIGYEDDDYPSDDTDFVAGVPEPSAALVMGAALVTVAAVRRLRRRD